MAQHLDTLNGCAVFSQESSELKQTFLIHEVFNEIGSVFIALEKLYPFFKELLKTVNVESKEAKALEILEQSLISFNLKYRDLSQILSSLEKEQDASPGVTMTLVELEKQEAKKIAEFEKKENKALRKI